MSEKYADKYALMPKASWDRLELLSKNLRDQEFAEIALRVVSQIKYVNGCVKRGRGSDIVPDEPFQNVFEYIKELEQKTKNIIHCEICGASWYDDGFTACCPMCSLAAEREKNKELEEQKAIWLGATNIYVKRIEDLEAKLRLYTQEAFEDVGEWGCYASDYFQTKWNLAGEIEKWRLRSEMSDKRMEGEK
jgi:hypothetical protein